MSYRIYTLSCVAHRIIIWIMPKFLGICFVKHLEQTVYRIYIRDLTLKPLVFPFPINLHYVPDVQIIELNQVAVCGFLTAGFRI